jgi:hypothetical protein
MFRKRALFSSSGKKAPDSLAMNTTAGFTPLYQTDQTTQYPEALLQNLLYKTASQHNPK